MAALLSLSRSEQEPGTKATQYKKFDVRPLLAEGIKPFPEIRKRVATRVPNEGLTIVAVTRPQELQRLLQKHLGEL